MKKFVALSMAAALLTSCFVGCGSSSSSDSGSSVKGKWEVSKMVEDGQTMEGEVMGTPVATFFQIELKDDGKAEAISPVKKSDGLSWKLDGDKLTIDDGEEKKEFKVDGDTMTCDMEGTEMTLKKVDEFTTKAAE